MHTQAFMYQEHEYQQRPQRIKELNPDGPSPVDDVEMARQLLQHYKLRNAIGGLLPNIPQLGRIRRVLDIGSGSGAWAIDLASTHPDMQVMGIDKNPRLVAYARQQAQASQIHNVTFQVQDINKLDEQILQPGSFDLVNIAFLSESLLEVTYPELLEKVATFCSPGGLLRWTEAAMPTTNSFAFEDFAMDIGRALREREYSFYTDPKTKQVEKMGECLMHFAFQRFTGITHCLAPWLRAIGYHNVHLHSYALDISYGTNLHYSFVRQVSVFYKKILPLLSTYTLLEEFEADYLYEELIEDLQDKDFCGLCHLVSVVGERPVA
ncbi:hypothetical protein KSC_056340 [Ktedonobacter sp. SOSP1-52]|uniref:class I SAM-dependent methyltransferase n=1 Tax=Ktedonobacter sp. SOSP1-52 TaxID=2778366 RepID=UPI001915A7AC|nr:class I SAM-dependent methyltransferase [Ktedonobacter sp. SOSP1-52]GHO66742.1 hypothetical protein KSC_056340 [Ktedonobacter sp. SOSP1-52]